MRPARSEIGAEELFENEVEILSNFVRKAALRGRRATRGSQYGSQQARRSIVGSEEFGPIPGFRKNGADFAAKKSDLAEKLLVASSADFERRLAKDSGYDPARDITAAQMVDGGPGVRMHDAHRRLVHQPPAGGNRPHAPFEIFGKRHGAERVLLPEIPAQNRKDVIEGSSGEAALHNQAFQTAPNSPTPEPASPRPESDSGNRTATGPRRSLSGRGTWRAGDTDNPLIGKWREHLFQPGIAQRNGVLHEHDAELPPALPDSEVSRLAVVERLGSDRNNARTVLARQIRRPVGGTGIHDDDFQ